MPRPSGIVESCYWVAIKIFIDCRGVSVVFQVHEERDPRDTATTNHRQLYGKQPLRSWDREYSRHLTWHTGREGGRETESVSQHALHKVEGQETHWTKSWDKHTERQSPAHSLPRLPFNTWMCYCGTTGELVFLQVGDTIVLECN